MFTKKEVQAYSYEMNFLIEVGGKEYDIQWCLSKIREYQAKAGM